LAGLLREPGRVPGPAASGRGRLEPLAGCGQDGGDAGPVSRRTAAGRSHGGDVAVERGRGAASGVPGVRAECVRARGYRVVMGACMDGTTHLSAPAADRAAAVSEAAGADIEHLGLERGHRTLTITRKCGKLPRFRIEPALHLVATDAKTSVANTLA